MIKALTIDDINVSSDQCIKAHMYSTMTHCLSLHFTTSYQSPSSPFLKHYS